MTADSENDGICTWHVVTSIKRDIAAVGEGVGKKDVKGNGLVVRLCGKRRMPVETMVVPPGTDAAEPAPATPHRDANPGTPAVQNRWTTRDVVRFARSVVVTGVVQQVSVSKRNIVWSILGKRKKQRMRMLRKS